MESSEFLNKSPALSGIASARSVAQSEHRIKKKIEHSGENSDKVFDIIVLGVGSMGSSTCYYLAKQGVKVLGLEQFEIPHEFGSHAGQSRIIRKAYYEHSSYVPLLERAYKNWKELEDISGVPVYFKTGLFYFGNPDHSIIKGVHESATKYKIRIDSVPHSAFKANYPQLNIPADYEKLFEPDAGFITPERAILLYAEQALLYGAVIKTKQKVLKWTKNKNEISVITSTGSYKAKKLVITAGPWAGKMVPELSHTLTVTRQLIAWVIPRKLKPFKLGTFPCWMIADETKPGVYYGFPILPVNKFKGPVGLKLAHHFAGSITDPDNINRVPSPEDESNLVYTLNKYFRDGYRYTQEMKTCMYTNTPDENFILDFLPGYDKDVIIATGFSGHGFKFASVVGEIMSDLAIKGSTQLPIGFLTARRYVK